MHVVDDMVRRKIAVVEANLMQRTILGPTNRIKYGSQIFFVDVGSTIK